MIQDIVLSKFLKLKSSEWDKMALLKCNQCGETVSSKAESCPHCGVALKFVTCKECGKMVSSKAYSCPHCGVDMDEKENSGCGCQGGCLALIIIFFLFLILGQFR
jgi:RNA polymerase subunit RPABC4/transcription elongation factor Spt4